MPRIRWINHASFVLEGGGAVILCDPWLEGAVFNNGWELLAPMDHPPIAFSDVTHLWFSHEHPDHFNPRSLKKILPGMGKVKVLFQETRDKRVVEYCAKQGLEVQELADGRREQIAPDVFVTVGKNGVEDSWALFEVEGHRVLNLNDCLFSNRGEMVALGRRLGRVDGLLSQFSYAEKIGNTGDTTLREATAKHYRDLLVEEATVFGPSWVIPMASFKYFSHSENFYLNQGSSRAREVLDALATLETAKPVLLFPGDAWTVGAEVDNAVAVARYEACEQAIRPRDYEDKPASFEELVALSTSFVQKLAEVNQGSWLFGLLCKLPFPTGLPRLAIWLDDLGYAGSLQVDAPFRKLESSRSECDIETTSPNMRYLFQHLSGVNALMVNGRYQASKGGSLKLFVFSHLALMASANIALSTGYVLRNVYRIILHTSSRLLRS